LPRIDCTIPITVVVRGRPGPEQIEALGETLARALESRLREAAARIRGRSGPRPEEAVRSPVDPARWDATGGYRIPSYDDGGKPTTVAVRGGRGKGPREATIVVRWTDDSDDFHDRFVSGLRGSAGFRGIRADEINTLAGSGSDVQGLRPHVKAFHTRYAMRHSDRKRGQRLTLRVTASYDPRPKHWTAPLTDIRIEVVVEPPKTTTLTPPVPVVRPQVGPATPPKPPAAPPQDETEEERRERLHGERLARHLPEVAAMIGRQLVAAAKAGANGARFGVLHDDAGLTPMYGEHGPPVAPGFDCRAASPTPFTLEEATAVARGALEHLGRKPRLLEVYFCFSGKLELTKWTNTTPTPPPPPGRASGDPEKELEEQIKRYRAWYSFAQTTIVEGLAEHDPTKPKNLVFNVAAIVVPIGAVKVAKNMGIVDSTQGMVKATRRADQATDAAKDLRRSRIVQQSERRRLQAKYGGRTRTEYPAETWDYIEQLETKFAGLSAADLRPLRRPAIADEWVRNERMQTSQGNFSFQGTLGRRSVQLDDISEAGWVIEVKYRNRTHWADRHKFEVQLRNHSDFARENGLPGVRWEVDSRASLDEVWNIIRDMRITNVVPVHVP
jgi:hypothetical protein